MKARVFDGTITDDEGNKALVMEYGGNKTPDLVGEMNTGDYNYDFYYNNAYRYAFTDGKEGEDLAVEHFVYMDDFREYYHASNLGEEMEFYNSIEDDPRLTFKKGQIVRRLEDNRYKYYEMKGGEWKTKYEHGRIESIEAPDNSIEYTPKKKGSTSKSESTSKPKF